MVQHEVPTVVNEPAACSVTAVSKKGRTPLAPPGLDGDGRRRPSGACGSEVVDGQQKFDWDGIILVQDKV